MLEKFYVTYLDESSEDESFLALFNAGDPFEVFSFLFSPNLKCED